MDVAELKAEAERLGILWALASLTASRIPVPQELFEEPGNRSIEALTEAGWLPEHDVHRQIWRYLFEDSVERETERVLRFVTLFYGFAKAFDAVCAANEIDAVAALEAARAQLLDDGEAA